MGGETMTAEDAQSVARIVVGIGPDDCRLKEICVFKNRQDDEYIRIQEVIEIIIEGEKTPSKHGGMAA